MSTAVVTGAGRGIGRAIALRLARDGHAVAVNDVNKAGAEAVAEEITAAGGRAVAVPADVADRDAVFAMVDRVATELGSVDVMVANAGIAQVKALLEVTPDDLRKIFDVNVFGVVYCLQAAAEKMIAQGTGGKIINAASVAGHSGFSLLGHYCGHEVRRPRADSGRGQGVGPAQDHGQRLLPGDRRHRHVGPHRREDGPLPGQRARRDARPVLRSSSRSAASRRPRTSPRSSPTWQDLIRTT